MRESRQAAAAVVSTPSREPVAVAPRPTAETAERARPGWLSHVPFAVLAAVCGATLLYLGRSLTFWQDEWRAIAFDGGWIGYLRPLNEHWSTFPLLLYRATIGLVGLRTYMPYLAEVVALHLIAVTGAYALMQRRVGTVVATLVAIPLLFLGVGAENLLWGFQTGFVGSVAFGVWALFFVERPGRRSAVAASVLLVASLTSSGVGLFFLVVTAGRTLSDPALRRRWVVVGPPAVAYLAWLVLFGREGVGSGGPVVVNASNLRFAVRGIIYANERVVGLDHLPVPYVWGVLLFVGLAVLTVRGIVRGRPRPLAAGCLLGVATMYPIISVGRVRADPGYDHATASRFVYVAAFFLVLAVVDLMPLTRSLPTRLRGITVLATIGLVVLGAATVANAEALLDKRSELQRSADSTRAYIAEALAEGDEPWANRTSPHGWMPSVEELVLLVERYGSPLHEAVFPGLIRAPTPVELEAQRLQLIGDGFRLEMPAGDGDGLAARAGPGTTQAGRCARGELLPGSAFWAVDLPAAGGRLRLTSSAELHVRMFLAHAGGPARELDGVLPPGRTRDVVIPDVGDGRPWVLALDSPETAGTVAVCVFGGDSGSSPTVSVRPWPTPASR
jgi:hypothetical protein